MDTRLNQNHGRPRTLHALAHGITSSMSKTRTLAGRVGAGEGKSGEGTLMEPCLGDR